MDDKTAARWVGPTAHLKVLQKAGLRAQKKVGHLAAPSALPTVRWKADWLAVQRVAEWADWMAD
jgi:hypothetical protein